MVCVAVRRCDAVDLVRVFLGLSGRRVGPAAGDDVVGNALGSARDEVQRNRREQAHTAALQEQHSVRLRDRPASRRRAKRKRSPVP